MTEVNGTLLNKITQGDCLIESNHIASGSVDLILTDLPYGTMKGQSQSGIYHKGNEQHDWDLAIDPSLVYEIANRILRKNGKMILFSQEPYTTHLINKAIPNVPFSYRAIWLKDTLGSFMRSNKALLYRTEDILMFSKHFESENNDDNPCKDYAIKVFTYINKPLSYLSGYYGNNNLSHFYSNGKQFRLCTEETYQKLIKDFNINRMDGFKEYTELKELNATYKGSFSSTFNLWERGKYKDNIFEYKRDRDGYHPTQKPVLLLEDLIKTFSNEGNTVADLTAGSGSTAVACINTNRNFIAIEKDEKYVAIANQRIADATQRN